MNFLLRLCDYGYYGAVIIGGFLLISMAIGSISCLL